MLKLAIVNVSGTVKISNLILVADAVVTPGALEEGASIGITKDTAFTDVLEDAESYKSYFRSADGSKVADVDADGKLFLVELQYCICGCGASTVDVEWLDANEYMDALTGARFTKNVHLRLSGDVNVNDIYGDNKQIAVGNSGDNVCVTIDLNGYTWNSGYRLLINKGNTLTLLDSSVAGTGKMIANGKAGQGGGVLCNSGTLNIYSGTYTQPVDGSNVYKGGVVYSSGTFNLYGGTITGGQAYDNGTTAGIGGNVCIGGGTFNMSSGTISGGIASQGSNVYILDGTFNHEGGTIEDKDNTVETA